MDSYSVDHLSQIIRAALCFQLMKHGFNELARDWDSWDKLSYEQREVCRGVALATLESLEVKPE